MGEEEQELRPGILGHIAGANVDEVNEEGDGGLEGGHPEDCGGVENQWRWKC